MTEPTIWDCLDEAIAKVKNDELGKDREEIFAGKFDFLRSDLTHSEYVDWSINGNEGNGRLVPWRSLNDFVLFRIAYSWPKNVDWQGAYRDISNVDFSLTPEMAGDLVEMSNEHLSDCVNEAEFYLHAAIAWHLAVGCDLPVALSRYTQRTMLCVPPKASGRKRSDLIDRDIQIRNTFYGLAVRNCPKSLAYELLAETLFLTPDAIRKVIANTPISDRGMRLYLALLDAAARN